MKINEHPQGLTLTKTLRASGKTIVHGVDKTGRIHVVAFKKNGYWVGANDDQRKVDFLESLPLEEVE